MVHSKPRWKWHECLEARGDINSNDSECENDDYIIHQEGFNDDNDMNDFTTKQQQLKEEAKYAFILGSKMARMQVEIEREELDKQRSPLYDVIGINANINKPLSIDLLEEMNIGQLQVIVNDLYCQIEANNDALINLLIQRDSLSMEQDSILVDIEDLTKRLEERANNQSSKQATEYVYIIKHPKENLPKQSIFQKFFRRKLFL